METCDNIAVHKQHNTAIQFQLQLLFFSGFIYPSILLNQSNYFSVQISRLLKWPSLRLYSLEFLFLQSWSKRDMSVVR